MYGLPADIDLSFFSAKVLQQVCVGANEVILNFDEYVSLTIMCTIECKTGPSDTKKLDGPRATASALIEYIQKPVISAKGDPNGTLVLTFEGGNCVTIYDDDKHFECYTVRYKDKTIVV